MKSLKTILDLNQYASLEDRVKGGILGFAIGDALGAPVEFKKSANPVSDFQPAYSKGLEKGQYTDDTQHLLIGIDSLLQNKGKINIEDLGARLQKWYNSGKARSLGRTTRQAIIQLNKGISPYESGIDNINNCGALGLARLFPFLLFSALSSYPSKINEKKIKDIVSITHAHKKVTKAGRLFNYFVQEMTHGNSARGVAYQIIAENEFLNKKTRDKLGEILDLSDDRTKESKEVIECIGNSGFIEDALYSALFSIFRGPTFREAMLNSVNGLGDSDTRAAIAGGLYGLQTGFSGLPLDWREKIEDSDILIKKSEELYRLLLIR